MRIDIAPDDDPVLRVRAATGASVVLVLHPGRDALSMAQAIAAIGPLAVGHAPTMRVNAVIPSATADPMHVDAAVAFLDRASSTTGQILAIT